MSTSSNPFRARFFTAFALLLAGCSTPTTSEKDDPSQPELPETPDPGPNNQPPVQSPACLIQTPGAAASWAVTELDENASLALAATDTMLVLYGATGARVSVDGGDTWSRLDTLPEGFFIRIMAGAGANLFVTGYLSGTGSVTYRSQDDGVTWTAVDELEGVSVMNLRASAHAVLADHFLWTEETDAFVELSNENFLFLLASDGQTTLGSPYGASFRTVNGQDWKPIEDLANVIVVRFAIEGNLAVAIDDLGGVWRSLDAGETWKEMAYDAGATGAIGDVFIAKDQVYFATTKGVVRSTDELVSFTLEAAAEATFGNLFFETQARIASSGGALFFTANDLLRSADAGDTWQAAPKLLDATPFALAKSGEYLFASTLDMKLHASEDGAAFSEIPSTGWVMTDFASDADTHFMLLRTSGPDSIAYYADGSLARLKDGEHKFDSIVLPAQSYTTTFGEVHVHEGVLFLGAESSIVSGKAPGLIDGPGIFRSTDHGATWEAANEGLVSSGENPQTYKSTYPAVVELASFGGEVFAGLGDGSVYRSLDAGRSWEPASEGLPSGAEPAAIDAFADAGGVLVAASSALPGSVFTWRPDAGAWTATVSDELPESGRIAQLAYHGGYLFAAVRRTGSAGQGDVYYSADLGKTWTDAGLGRGTRALLVRDDVLFAGTDGEGLWTLGLGPCEVPAE